MSGLVIYTPNQYSPQALEKLSPVEKGIILLAINNENNLKISQMLDQNEIKAFYDGLIIDIHISLQLGAKETLDTASIMIAMHSGLLRKFPNITQNEVKEAVNIALEAGYSHSVKGKVFFNPANFLQWVDSYVSEIKEPAVVKANKAQLHLKTPDQTEAVTEKTNIISQFRRLVKISVSIIDGTQIDDFGGLAYDVLTRFGTMKAIEWGSDEVNEAALELREIAKSSGLAAFRRAEHVLKRVLSGSDRESEALTHARVKAVHKHLKSFDNQEDLLDYLEFIKQATIEYFKENNL